ncbi:MAG: DUF502 domain-containing protein [Pirellulales bacterium]|nr:DUF502 domain-containing protein [Pirellulales bacterium]
MRWIIDRTFRRAARCFLAGIIAILPVVITVAVVTWVGALVSRFLGPSTVIGQALRGVGLRFATNETAAYAVGAALVLVLIFLIGAAAEAGAKNLLQRLADALLQRIPIIGSVYGTSKQLVGIVDKKPDDNLKGMRAVFCYFGTTGGAGILALLVSPERFRVDGRDCHIVIVPTAPVPVGGGLLFVPAEIVKPADVSIEALMSIYVSMGVTAPQFLPLAQSLEQTH